MKVWVLAVSNGEGCCRPSVYDSKEKALKALEEAYQNEISEWTDDNGNLIEVDEDGDHCPILDFNLNLEGGWAYVTYEDERDFCVNFEIYEAEVE